MKALSTARIARVLLAISVSLWMAGAGCLWGCSNGPVSAAGVSVPHNHETPTVVSGSSCHSKAQPKAQSHDCCAKKSAGKNITEAKRTSALPTFSAIPAGMMKDCPLAVSANALATKGSADASSPGLATINDLPIKLKTTQRTVAQSSPVQYLNRGPTYLRCCVFLI